MITLVNCFYIVFYEQSTHAVFVNFSHKFLNVNVTNCLTQETECVSCMASALFVVRICLFCLLQDKYIAATYYYAALHDSEYSFAFSFSDTDKVILHMSLIQRVI